MRPALHNPFGPFGARHTRLLLAAAGLAIAAAFGGAAAQPEPEQNPAATHDIAPAADKEPPEAEILLLDGKRVTGTLIEQTDEKVVIAIAGIPTTFSMSTVNRVKTLPPVEERYEALRSIINVQDVDGTLRLAEWVRSKGRLDLAMIEVERVLKLEPTNPAAKDLKTLVLAQLAVSANKAEARSEQGLAQGPATDFPLLTKEQINLIRVFEVDLANPPRMIITRDTVKRFLEKYAGVTVEGKGQLPTTPEGREVFYRMRPAEVLAWMFELKAREFYPEVTVQDNPKAFQTFRDGLNRNWVVNACATTRCHGGEEAGRLWLYNKLPSSDQSAYTNFLILDRFRLANGQPLISYGEPARSPLLQMGLPRDLAVTKHPEVQGAGRGRWQPVFRSEEDARFTQAVEWIKAMYPKRPDYPVDYTVPTPKSKGPRGLDSEGQLIDR